MKGDCPSFLRSSRPRGRRRKATPSGWPAPPTDLPAPALRVPRDDFVMRMPGVGGHRRRDGLADPADGGDARRQALVRARPDGPGAEGRARSSPTSGSRATRSRAPTRRRPGAADLLLGFDLLGAANPKNLLVADPARTVAVVNTHAVADRGDGHRHRRVASRRCGATRRRSTARTRGRERLLRRRGAVSEALFGDHMPTNTLLIGAAYQAGCLPLSADALEQAIRLNGAAVEKNLAAFAWGRAVVAAPEAVASSRPAAASRRPGTAAAAPQPTRRGRPAPTASCAACSRSACPS